jgi:hypothetical protein
MAWRMEVDIYELWVGPITCKLDPWSSPLHRGPGPVGPSPCGPMRRMPTPCHPMPPQTPYPVLSAKCYNPMLTPC